MLRLRPIRPILITSLAIAGLAAGCQKQEPAAPTPAAQPATTQTLAQAATPTPTPEPTATPTPTPTPRTGPWIDLGSSRRTSPVSMLRATQPEDPDLMFYVKMRAPAMTFDRITSWITQINPDADVAGMRERMTQRGLDLEQFRKGASVILYEWKPPSEGESPMWAVQLPISQDSPMMLMIGMIAPATAMVGNDLFVAGDQATLDKAEAAQEDLRRISAAGMPVDLMVFLNTETMFGYYGRRMRQAVEGFEDMIMQSTTDQASQANVGRYRAMQRAMRARSQMVLDLLDQTRCATFAIDLNPEAAEASLCVEPKPGTALETALNQPPVSAPDLTHLMGPGHTVAWQVNVADNIPLAEGMMRYFTAGSAENDSETTPPMVATLYKLIREDGLRQYAMAMDVEPDKPIVGGMVAEADKPAEVLAELRDNVDLLNVQLLGSTRDQLVDATTEVQRGVRQIQGQPVDDVAVRLHLAPGVSTQIRTMIRGMWGSGPINLEMLPFGDVAFLSIGISVDQLVALATAEERGKPINARTVFPAGGLLYGDVDIVRYMQTTMALMPQGPGTTRHELIDAPPLAFAAWHQNGLGYYRAHFPIGLAQGLRTMGQQARDDWRAANPNGPPNGRRGPRGMRGPGAPGAPGGMDNGNAPMQPQPAPPMPADPNNPFPSGASVE